MELYLERFVDETKAGTTPGEYMFRWLRAIVSVSVNLLEELLVMSTLYNILRLDWVLSEKYNDEQVRYVSLVYAGNRIYKVCYISRILLYHHITSTLELSLREVIVEEPLCSRRSLRL